MLNVLIEIRALQVDAFVVVVHDIPKRFVRTVVKVRLRHQHVAQFPRFEGGNIGFFLSDEKAAKRRHLRLNGSAIDGRRIPRVDELLGLLRQRDNVVPDDRQTGDVVCIDTG